MLRGTVHCSWPRPPGVTPWPSCHVASIAVPLLTLFTGYAESSPDPYNPKRRCLITHHHAHTANYRYRTLLLRMRRCFVVSDGGWRLACHHLFLFLRADLFLAALLLLDLDHLQNRLARFDGLGVPNFGLYLGQVPGGIASGGSRATTWGSRIRSPQLEVPGGRLLSAGCRRRFGTDKG